MPSPSLTLLRTQSDERLVALAREGHERAFEAIVERYRRPLLRGARRVLPEARAEDALQQALLSAWTALQQGDEVRDLRPWLFRIVHNCSLNALRVAGYEYDELHDALRIADAPGVELERRAVMRQTLASVAALPDRQREALLRTAVSGDPHDEVARSLGVSDNALRQLVHRARVSIRTAATAITPLPLITWLAAGGSRGSLAERIAELAAGAAPVGAAATLAKVGTVAVVAGGALTGPAVIDNFTDQPPKRASVAAEASAASRPAPASTPAAPRRAAAVPATKEAAGPSRAAARRAHDGAGEDRSGRRRSGREQDEGDREDSDDAEDRRDADRGGGSPRSGSERHESNEDRSGPGGGEEPADEPAGDVGELSGSGSGVSGHSGPDGGAPSGSEPSELGSGDRVLTEDALSQPLPVPTETPEPEDD